jgi:hypothetical protein
VLASSIQLFLLMPHGRMGPEGIHCWIPECVDLWRVPSLYRWRVVQGWLAGCIKMRHMPNSQRRHPWLPDAPWVPDTPHGALVACEAGRTVRQRQ